MPDSCRGLLAGVNQTEGHVQNPTHWFAEQSASEWKAGLGKGKMDRHWGYQLGCNKGAGYKIPCVISCILEYCVSKLYRAEIHPLALENILHTHSKATASKSDYHLQHLFLRILCLELRDENSAIPLSEIQRDATLNVEDLEPDIEEEHASKRRKGSAYWNLRERDTVETVQVDALKQVRTNDCILWKYLNDPCTSSETAWKSTSFLSLFFCSEMVCRFSTLLSKERPWPFRT